MECKEIMNKLDGYIENRLNDIDAYKVEKHLERCPECRREYEELKSIFDILSSHPVILPPDDFTTKVMNEIRPKIKKNRIKPMVIRKWGISFVAAGLLIFVLNTSFGYSIQDISGYICNKPFSINNQISNYVKELPTTFFNSYKRLKIKEIKLFKNRLDN